MLAWLLHVRAVRRSIAFITVAVVVGVVIAGIVGAVTGGGGPLSLLLFFLLYGAAVYLAARLWLRHERRRRFRIARFNDLLALTPRQFEVAMGQLLHDRGYRKVEVRGGAGDLAADITCRDPQGHLVVVQCKRYAPGIRVGSGEVQSFIGMMTVHHRADHGIFVTTSGFTQPAAELGRKHGVELIDGERLRHIVAGMQPEIADMAPAAAGQ